MDKTIKEVLALLNQAKARIAPVSMYTADDIQRVIDELKQKA